MVFIGKVLSKILGVKNSKDIRSRLLQSMDHWNDGLTRALVKDTRGTNKARNGHSREISKRERKKRESTAYDQIVKDGHIQAVARQATDRGKGGVLHVNITYSKSGMIILDVLQLKHSGLQEVDLDDMNFSAFEAYYSNPKVILLDITSSDVELRARNMGGSGGSSGKNSTILKGCCTNFGSDSESLREELAGCTLCISNVSPLWVAYCALMAGRLVALDNSPGVLPVGIDKAIRRLMENLVQSITDHQSLEACGSNNLYDMLKSGIMGAVQANKRDFGKMTPPNAVLPNSHPEGATGLGIVLEG